jgi:type I restriction enzyme S subunit
MEVTDVQYKESEIGVLPLDWEVKTLGDVGEVKMCRRVFNQETKLEGVIPFYKIGTFGKEADAYISQELYDNYRQRFSFPKTGDVLISAAGTIGRTMVYDGEPAYYQDSNIVWIDNKEGLVLNKYLYYVLQVAKYNTEGGTIQRLYNSILKNTKFICPTKSEQTAISTALSDTDALIENLEKLIAKKRNIKQGVMQELLTGRKRLAGFNGEWGIRKLGDLAEMYSGGTPLTTNDSFYNGDIPWVVIADMTKSGKYIYKTEKTITETGLQNSSAKLFKKGVILFAMYASIGKCTIAQMDTACNQAILGVSTKLIDTEFLYYYLSYNESKFIRMGQTGTQSNLNKEIVQELKIPFPQRNEQIEIAGFLSSIDNEIDGLEQKLRKSQMIKQGMMQTLLTGKIRLA